MRLTTLEQLHQAALNRRAVTVMRYGSAGVRIPAAFVINMMGTVLVHLFSSGIYLYEPKTKPHEKTDPVL